MRRLVVLLSCLTCFDASVKEIEAEEYEIRGRIHEAGQAVAARLYIEDADGRFFHAQAASGTQPAVPYRVRRSPSVHEIHTALPAAPFTAKLPAGQYKLTVIRGKEYLPKTVALSVPMSPVEVVDISIHRWIDMPAQGWYSGDTHIHRPLEQVPVPALADDVHMAFPLTYWVTDSEQTPPESSKSIRTPMASDPIRLDPTHWIHPINTEYELFTYQGQRHTLGAVFVIGHRKPLELKAPPTRPIARAAREQYALLDLDKHTWPWSPMIVPIMKVDLFELANNHIWLTNFLFRDWTIETLPDDWDIETDDGGGWTERGWIDFGFKCFYAFLNCGFDMQPTGGTATGVHPVPMGFGRVYVQVDGPLTIPKWLSALRQGRSFVTTGPMLTTTFDGEPHGSRIQCKPGEPHILEVTGTAASRMPLSAIEVIVNGDVAVEIKPSNERQADGTYRTHFVTQVKLTGTSWLAVRCFEPRANGRFFYAHTAATHVRFGDEKVTPRLREVRYFLQRVQSEIERNRELLSEPELDEFIEARRIYETLLKRAR